MTKDYRAADYKCGTCGATGCKLWREYNTFLDHQTLLCALCAGKSESKDVSQIDADGKLPWYHREHNMGLIDQIGMMVPAVPTYDGSTFWGYMSVPDEAVQWWRALPTLPNLTP